MSRTRRSDFPDRFWYRHENSWARQLTRRTERNRARQLMRNDRFDLADTRQTKPTQGWLTW
jgi:hypothetical protein